MSKPYQTEERRAAFQEHMRAHRPSVIGNLTIAADLNPYIGEPLVLLAQIHLNEGRLAEAKSAAASALER